MIKSTNADEIAKQLKEFAEENRRRLKSLVEEFAVQVVTIAGNITPLGDSETFAKQYERRHQQNPELPEEEGVARGAWVVSLEGLLYFVVNSGQGSVAEAMEAAQYEMQYYKLGEDFVIGNAAPYIGALENNWSPQTTQGIVKPTVDQIMQITVTDFKSMYDNAE